MLLSSTAALHCGENYEFLRLCTETTGVVASARGWHATSDKQQGKQKKKKRKKKSLPWRVILCARILPS
jgi:hypothetical protein